MATRPGVLFVCRHGSAKNPIVREYFERLAAERGISVDARSAGTEADADIPSGVVQGVVAFGCELADLVPPGPAVERWGDVPAASEDSKKAGDAIVARVTRLLAEPTALS